MSLLYTASRIPHERRRLKNTLPLRETTRLNMSRACLAPRKNGRATFVGVLSSWLLQTGIKGETRILYGTCRIFYQPKAKPRGSPKNEHFAMRFDGQPLVGKARSLHMPESNITPSGGHPIYLPGQGTQRHPCLLVDLLKDIFAWKKGRKGPESSCNWHLPALQGGCNYMSPKQHHQSLVVRSIYFNHWGNIPGARLTTLSHQLQGKMAIGCIGVNCHIRRPSFPFPFGLIVSLYERKRGNLCSGLRQTHGQGCCHVSLQDSGSCPQNALPCRQNPASGRTEQGSGGC